MRNRLLNWILPALLGLVGPAHAAGQAPTDPAPAPSASTEDAGESERIEPDDRPAEGEPPVDDNMLEYLDILVEIKILDSLETIDALQAAEEEDAP